MAEVTIANNGNPTLKLPGQGGPFWVSENVGAYVYVDWSSDVGARATSTGVSGWGSAIVAEAGSIGGFNCWFEPATPGLSSDSIHCSWLDNDAGDTLKYAAFDVSAQTWGTIRSIAIGLTYDATDRYNRTWISVSRSGNIGVAYQILDTTTGSEGFYVSADTGATWTSKASPWDHSSTTQVDELHLFPASTADDDDLCGVYYDRGSLQWTVKMFDHSANSWTEQTTGAWTVTGDDFLAMPHSHGAVRHSDGKIIFATHDDPLTTGDDLQIHEINPNSISGPTITGKTNAIANTDGMHMVNVALDQTTDDIYVAYLRGTSAQWKQTGADFTAYYVKSTDDATSWGTEQTYGHHADDHHTVTGPVSVGTGGGHIQWAYCDDDGSGVYASDSNHVTISASGLTPRLTLLGVG
ncbi:MAG: hypothetical protein HOH95_09680 [Dehalococcoidia bacterium]|nr:hypothetical protein [Dehalococcoidia bacterium]